MVTLEGKDAFGRASGKAVVQAPRSLPRLVRLPASVAQAPYDFVFLSSIVHANVGDLFPGMKVTGCYQFRVTRNSDLFVDEEEVDDLLRALEGELPARRFGDEVRLEIARRRAGGNQRVADVAEFGLTDNDIYLVSRAGESESVVGAARPRRSARSEVPGFIPGVPERSEGEQGSLRGDPQRRRAAAPSVSGVHAGRRFSAAGGGRSGRVVDPADVVSHRLRFNRSEVVGGCGERRQRRARRDRTARALRRTGEHRTREPAAGCRRAGRIWRGAATRRTRR